jgi:hypothetical protein
MQGGDGRFGGHVFRASPKAVTAKSKADAVMNLRS